MFYPHVYLHKKEHFNCNKKAIKTLFYSLAVNMSKITLSLLKNECKNEKFEQESKFSSWLIKKYVSRYYYIDT